MKKLIVSLASLCAFAFATHAQSTSFTYQGRLTDGDAPAEGLYDLRFNLFAAVTNSVALSDPFTQLQVAVSNGLFTVALDFGSTVFMGGDRWLEISVRTNGSAASYTTLSPRQPITATPHALHAFNAANLMSFANAPLDIKVNGQRALRLEPTTNSPNIIGGFRENLVGPNVVGATIAGGGGIICDPDNPPFCADVINRADGSFGTIGGGLGNHTMAFGATIAGGQQNSSALDAWNSFIGGGFGNAILGYAASATIAGGYNNRVNGPNAVIGGGYENRIDDWSWEAVLGGGLHNIIEGAAPFATISGGAQNIIQTNTGRCTIGGGINNLIRSETESATIGGGDGNVIGSDSFFSTIAGGEHNIIVREAWNSTIGGGETNRIETQTDNATIAGGGYNIIGVSSDSSTIAGGLGNIVRANAVYASIGGGIDNLIANSASGATIGGGDDNEIANDADAATIAGGSDNAIGPHAAYATIAGGYENDIGTNAANSFVGGGERNAIQVDAAHATIAGGERNSIAGESSFIGGGLGNNTGMAARFSAIGGGLLNNIDPGAAQSFIGGGAANHVLDRAQNSVIGGGEQNVIDPDVRWAFIGGGIGNRNRTNAHFGVVGGGINNWNGGNAGVIAGGNENSIGSSAIFATISGGFENVVQTNAAFATIPGGEANEAAAHSFAAGRRAKARAPGSFVWGDTNDFDVVATNVNEFVARATGGFSLITAVDGTGAPTAGAALSPGSGSWSMLSDRNAKENFVRANSRGILDKLAALPLATWNYKAQDKSLRHIGPTAQDFHAAFGVGEDERRISAVDADGVALAAIQGLNQKVEDENRALRAELKTKETEIQELKKGLADLRQLFDQRSFVRP